MPRYNGQEELREIETLYLDGINAAEQWIYMENQYLTSQVIIDALCESLEKRKGPEILIVLPRITEGWLEQHTMDVLRDRQLQRLSNADRHNRLRSYYAKIPGTQPQFVQIHSKVMVVDNRLLTVGSANLSNRSMGFDSECNLALESGSVPQHQQGIAAFRHRLLAEHLGTEVQVIADVLASSGSLIATIDRLSGGERSLVPMAGSTPEVIDSLVPDQHFLDPEQPIEAERMVNLLVSEEEQKPAGGHLLSAGILLGSLLLLAILWRWTPLGAWLNPERLQGFFESIAALPGSPLLIIAVFVVAGLLVVPLTVLVGLLPGLLALSAFV